MILRKAVLILAFIGADAFTMQQPLRLFVGKSPASPSLLAATTLERREVMGDLYSPPPSMPPPLPKEEDVVADALFGEVTTPEADSTLEGECNATLEEVAEAVLEVTAAAKEGANVGGVAQRVTEEVSDLEVLLEVLEASSGKSSTTLEIPADTEPAAQVSQPRRDRKRDKLLAFAQRVVGNKKSEAKGEELSFGEQLEAGWARRGSGSSLRRNVEVWKFGAKAVLRVVKANKVEDDEARALASTDAATFIRDGLVRLGPTFVKLGQVVSTRTDIFSDAYIQVLRTLQDDVPAFSGARAQKIIEAELGVSSVDQLFSSFEVKPLAAASLGQVHTATLLKDAAVMATSGGSGKGTKKGVVTGADTEEVGIKVLKAGTKVAIKVQRAGLKELFDVDLKNLKKLAVLLDKFDPKSDGADRDWVSIYDESARLLYLEIDYLNEAQNTERFRSEFKGTPWVRIPFVVPSLTTPRVLVMEFVESLKLTDIGQIDSLKLDKQLLAKRTADSFLAQVLRTGYFHCDPHPGNLCVDAQGNLVYYDYGMMDELSPTVREGFRNLCFALFEGGPFISDIALARQGRQFKLALEQMGVLAKGADTLAVEKFGRFCINTFKEVQKGGSPSNIKTAIGGDLQALTEAQVFRFPSTFTFIFRAFASIDGIGKGLDPKFDIGTLAQPFIEGFTDEVKYGANAKNGGFKFLSVASKATGLNLEDVSTAVSSPRKIAYLEETVRAMEQGSLKIRVRSLENERSLERIALVQARTSATLLTAAALNVALTVSAGSVGGGVGAARAAATYGSYLATGFLGLQALGGAVKVKAFDKKAAKYEAKDFGAGRAED